MRNKLNASLKYLLPAVIVLSAILLSCQKKEAAQAAKSGENAAAENTEIGKAEDRAGGATEPEEPVSSSNYAYALRVDTDFFTMTEDTGAKTDVIKWKGVIPLGEKVFLLGPLREATYNGKVYECYKINWDGGEKPERYVWANRFAVGGALAVVVADEANVYKTAQNLTAQNFVLPHKLVVVYFPETEKDTFVKFTAYDAAVQITRTGFVKTSAISKSAEDVQSSILLQTALNLSAKESIRKEALLNAAINDFPQSAFFSEIEEALNPPPEKREVQTSSGIFTVNDDNVNVRNLPDEKNGALVGQLPKGEEVTVAEETVKTYTIGEKTNKWYHITAPMDGWIFGSFLESRN
jgi:hypothetical protein